MPNITKEDLFKDKDYFKCENIYDPGFIYTVWQGDTLSNNLDIFLVCWVNEDGLPTGIDYKTEEVLKYLNNGTWVIIE